MNLGAVLPHATFRSLEPAALVSFVEKLENAGYDHVLLRDRIVDADVPLREEVDVSDEQDIFLEPLVVFAFLASRCRLEFVTDVLVLAKRRISVVARQVASLAVVAPGRLRLGVGFDWDDGGLVKNWHRDEPDTVLDAQIPALRSLCEDVQVWIGSGPDERALTRVALLGDGWIASPSIQPGPELAKSWERIQGSARTAGVAGPARFEGHAEVIRGDERQIVDVSSRWRDHGAAALALYATAPQAEWPEEHLATLLVAADLILSS